MTEKPASHEAVVQNAINTVVQNLIGQGDHLAEQGFPKSLYVTALTFALAQLSKDLGMPTVTIGMALSRARQTIDDRGVANVLTDKIQ